MIRFVWSLALLAGCTSVSAADEPDHQALHWLTGCWQSESGGTREVWSLSEGGYYFGYSVVMQNGQVVFFEQMRIDPARPPVFNAYPAGSGPSAFPAIEMGDQTITFANANHDYPQKIRYWRDGEALRAKISLIDDGQPGTFDFVACSE